MDRAPAIAAAIAACAAAVVAACTLVTSLDGLSEGAAPGVADAKDERGFVGDGSVDERSDGAIATSRYATAVLADKPILYYRFGEKGGAPARDEVTGATTAYPVSGGKLGVAGALAGDPDTAIALDGSFKLKLAQRVDFQGVTPFSVEVWLSPTTTATGGGFIVDHEAWDGRRGWLLSANSVRFGFERWFDGGSSSIGVEQPAVDGEWHHVIMSFDGTTQRLYIDGLRRTTGMRPVPLVVIGVPWTVGGQNCAQCSGNGFTGSVDELAIYGSALSEERIAAHFGAGR